MFLKSNILISLKFIAKKTKSDAVKNFKNKSFFFNFSWFTPLFFLTSDFKVNHLLCCAKYICDNTSVVPSERA